jgi:predicted ribonuclease YlaK
MLKDGISLTNDAKIIACARHFAITHPEDEIIFVSNDLICRHIASMYFKTETVIEETYEYDGYEEVYLDEDEMAEFYSNPYTNTYGLYINQYLIIYEKESGKCVDQVRWDGETYRRLNYNTFTSKWFGDVKPMKNDIYQTLAADSLTNNKITMIKGPAGSGKTYLSLGFLMHKLERNKIDKIIVFCNTVATKNSAKLGYYPGTKDEKLLDSQIGNLLISKFGGRDAVERMIAEEKLVLLPMSDIRGYDTSGMCAGIYISEA